MLCEEFDPKEFQIAVFQMHKNKSHGPDGFNLGFYKKFWNVVGPDIVSLYLMQLEECHFPANLNDMIVVLTPKCDNPKTMKDLRPISLCNVVYKLISKVMYNRLKRVLPGIIDESQSAFVSGSLIQDNVLITFETIHAMRNKRFGKWRDMALKINISKAYDRVYQRFLNEVLRKMGFSERWVSWMNICVQTVTYSFTVNDRIMGPIKLGRGLTQCDPLSPYLFIICAKWLSSLLRW